MRGKKFDTTKIIRFVSKSSRRGPKTKQQIADHFGLSRTFVQNTVNQLVGDGLLFEAGKVETGQRGRPHILYRSL